eukprot:CAMPEP_0184479958 /NCGR_PEP_ID=MMETSP0113_2-20130426/1471_1 /TAXON_ID=91329 /ORGANISM="Norrisiella sphaerica, Strain BC52" /LENGTH=44 /DNA_ID= /DNA_START= /DNA_END= /DNA_ORIENTATION=
MTMKKVPSASATRAREKTLKLIPSFSGTAGIEIVSDASLSIVDE